MVVAPDLSIYVAGHTAYPDIKFLLAHLSASGIPDTDLGTGGIVITPVTTGSSQCKDIAIQPDGKIVLIGDGNDDTASIMIMTARIPTSQSSMPTVVSTPLLERTAA